MLSNVLIKANLLAYNDHVQEPKTLPAFQSDLGSINAFELRSIHERFPDMDISFNPSRYVKVNERQQAQWTARLFFKDMSLSLSEEGRANWYLEPARKTLPIIDEILPTLDVEDALELLWLADKIASSASSNAVPEAADARMKLLAFLKHNNFHEQAAIDRVRAFSA